MPNPASSRQERKTLLPQNGTTRIDAALAKICPSHAKETDSAESAALVSGAGDYIGVEMGRALSICASLLLVAAPFQTASAQQAQQTASDQRNVSVTERTQPDYNPLGLRLGGFDLNASVEFAAVNSDNVFAEEAGAERDDTFFEVRPEANLRSHWSRHQLEASAGASFSQYENFSNEDANSNYVALGGRYDIGRATAVGANLSTTHGVESRTEAADALGVDDPNVEYDFHTASAYVAHEFSRLRLRGTISQTDYDFKGGDPATFDQNDRDNTVKSVSGRVEYVLSPRFGILGQATADERDYDQRPDQDSSGRTLLAGVRMDLTNLMRGEFSVGQFSRDYDTGTIDGVAVAGRVNWFATPLTTVTAEASRNVQASSIVTPYVNTRLGLRVDHELRRNITLYAGVISETHEFDDAVIDREDDVQTYDAGVRYLMNRRVSFGAGYTRNEFTSEGVDAYRDYEENRARLSVRFAL